MSATTASAATGPPAAVAGPVSAEPMAAPARASGRTIEAVMLGQSGTAGISFTSQGRTLKADDKAP